MNIEIISIIVFLLFLLFVLYYWRRNVAVQKILFPILYFAMFRTKFGIKFMKSFSKKHPKLVSALGVIGVYIGFLGMAFIAWALIWNLIQTIMSPVAVQGVALVLPFKAKGVFYVPFFYWIISIFVLAIVHEFAHGVVAKRYGVKIKSSGFAFFCIFIPLIPAAFVEPDEKTLVKKTRMQQLSVFAAGPLANVILGIACLLILTFVLTPIAYSFLEPSGIRVKGVMDGYGAADAGLVEGDILLSMDGVSVLDVQEFTNFLDSKQPGDVVDVKTANASYSLVLSKNPNSDEAYVGIYVAQENSLTGKYSSGGWEAFANVFLWIIGLFYWLYLLNIGVGLFNLVPLGPIDGGRMLLVGLERFFKKQTAYQLWKWISLFFLLLILVNIFIGFVI